MGKHLFTRHLLFSSFCAWSSSHLKAQIPTHFSLTQGSYKPQLSDSLWASNIFMGLLYILNYVHLSYVNWIVSPPEESRKPSLLPLQKQKFPTQRLAHHRCLIGISWMDKNADFWIEINQPCLSDFSETTFHLCSPLPHETGEIIITISSPLW